MILKTIGTQWIQGLHFGKIILPASRPLETILAPRGTTVSVYQTCVYCLQQHQAVGWTVCHHLLITLINIFICNFKRAGTGKPFYSKDEKFGMRWMGWPLKTCKRRKENSISSYCLFTNILCALDNDISKQIWELAASSKAAEWLVSTLELRQAYVTTCLKNLDFLRGKVPVRMLC